MDRKRSRARAISGFCRHDGDCYAIVVSGTGERHAQRSRSGSFIWFYAIETERYAAPLGSSRSRNRRCVSYDSAAKPNALDFFRREKRDDSKEEAIFQASSGQFRAFFLHGGCGSGFSGQIL